MYIALGVLVYAALVLAFAGFLLADIQRRNKYTNGNRYYRSDLAASVGLCLIPITWLFTPFLTGFFEYGWTLSRPKEGK